MMYSIYDDQHMFATIERMLPKEIEEIYVEEHGVEPQKRHILILMKFGRR